MLPVRACTKPSSTRAGDAARDVSEEEIYRPKRRAAWVSSGAAHQAAILIKPKPSRSHSIGFARAEKGRDLREIQDFLDHCSINNTVIYTKLRPGRFDRIWD